MLPKRHEYQMIATASESYPVGKSETIHRKTFEITRDMQEKKELSTYPLRLLLLLTIYRKNI